MSSQQMGFIRALSDLLAKLDEHLLPGGRDYVYLVAATSEIRAKLEAWTRGDGSTLDMMQGHSENPVVVIRRILEKSPDTTDTPVNFRIGIHYRSNLQITPSRRISFC